MRNIEILHIVICSIAFIAGGFSGRNGIFYFLINLLSFDLVLIVAYLIQNMKGGKK